MPRVKAGIFSVEQPDGFLIPYGEHPHEAGLQVFDRPAAEVMVARFNSLASRIRRVFFGLPVYIGHPDASDDYEDTRAYAWINSLAAQDGGLFCAAKYTERGAALVNDAAFKGYSPFWLCEPIAERPGALRPVELISMGLTNTPNIAVPPLANASALETQAEYAKVSRESYLWEMASEVQSQMEKVNQHRVADGKPAITYAELFPALAAQQQSAQQTAAALADAELRLVQMQAQIDSITKAQAANANPFKQGMANSKTIDREKLRCAILRFEGDGFSYPIAYSKALALVTDL